jgi:WD40 repeat protein
MDKIALIDQSEHFQNKYQFSLKNYMLNRNITKHTEAINSICCLEDGRVVTGGEDKKVLIWSDNFEKIDLALLDNARPVKLVKLLNDGRLAVGGYQNIKIYNNLNNFKISCILKDISNNVVDMINLEDGRIITCSEDKTMKMIKVDNEKYTVEQTLQGHNGYVVKIIEFNKNELISISNDNSMKFWNINKENRNFTCIKSVTFQNGQNYYIGILKIKENEFVTVSNGDNTIKFWNYTNYSLIKEIKGINPNFTYHQICLINENILCVCNFDELILFNINSRELIKKN